MSCTAPRSLTVSAICALRVLIRAGTAPYNIYILIKPLCLSPPFDKSSVPGRSNEAWDNPRWCSKSAQIFVDLPNWEKDCVESELLSPVTLISWKVEDADKCQRGIKESPIVFFGFLKLEAALISILFYIKQNRRMPWRWETVKLELTICQIWKRVKLTTLCRTSVELKQIF